MSLVIANGGTQALSRATNIVPGSSDYTAIMWVNLTNVTGAFYRNYFTQVNGIGTYTQWAGLFCQNGEENVYLGTDNGGGFTNSDPSGTMTLGQWYPIAYVRDGTDQHFYFNFALIDTITKDLSATSFSEQWLGNDTSSNGAHQIKGFREWNKAITSLTALKAEWMSPTAVDTVNLWADTPLVSDGNDVSGNARHWTAVNAPSYVNNMNQVTDAILPETYTLTPTDDGDVFDFYYLADETKVIGEFTGVSSLSGNYDPETTVEYWNGSSWVVVNSLSGINQRPLQIPVNSGNPYRIHIENFAAGSPGRDIVVTFLDGPNNIPADITGTVIITEEDATADFSVSGLINIQTGIVLFLPRTLNSSENGAVSPTNGNFVLTGDNSPILGNVYFYDNAFNLLATDTTTAAGAGQLTPPASSSNNFFYVARYMTGDAVIKVWRWTFAGVLDATSWDIPLPAGWTNNRVSDIAVSKNDDRLYYSYFTSGTPDANTNVIKVWDLVNSVALPDLATTNLNYRNKDIRYSSDNFIYQGGSDLTAPVDAVIWKYNGTGTLISTIQLDNSKGFLDHFALGAVDTASLVVWQQIDPDPNDSQKRLFTYSTYALPAGTLSFLTENIRDFTGNTGPLVAFGSVPPEDFGVSNSCPLLIMLEGGTPPPPPNPLSGIYKIIPGSEKPNDTLWANLETLETIDVAIPNPFIEGPGIGS